jgi:cyclopropane fatty-acyl-phospholipid synthase-like methyltransferase
MALAWRQRTLRAAVGQFGNPHGAAGHVAGWIMGRRSSNVARSRWAIDLLELRPTDRFLEIGCGPGVALQAAAARAAAVVGVDRSPVMIGQARRRNRAAVQQGRVTLHVASIESLPELGAPFDKALAVNTVGFWTDAVAGLGTVRERLRAGGTVAVVSQPRCPGATSVDSQRAAAELETLLGEAGHVDVRTHTLDTLDPPAVCVLARAP